MFLRPHFRTVDGTRHAYWSLVESVRTERGPRQRVVAYLGGLDEAGRLGVQQAADENSTTDNQPSLFDDESTQPRYADVDLSKVRVENCREFGGPWLAWQLIRRLGLDAFLQQTIPRGVVEELFLPGVDLRGLQLELVTEVGNRHPLNQMPFHNRRLFRGTETSSSLLHGDILHSCCRLTRRASHSISNGGKTVSASKTR